MLKNTMDVAKVYNQIVKILIDVHNLAMESQSNSKRIKARKAGLDKEIFALLGNTSKHDISGIRLSTNSSIGNLSTSLNEVCRELNTVLFSDVNETDNSIILTAFGKELFDDISALEERAARDGNDPKHLGKNPMIKLFRSIKNVFEKANSDGIAKTLIGEKVEGQRVVNLLDIGFIDDGFVDIMNNIIIANDENATLLFTTSIDDGRKKLKIISDEDYKQIFQIYAKEKYKNEIDKKRDSLTDKVNKNIVDANKDLIIMGMEPTDQEHGNLINLSFYVDNPDLKRPLFMPIRNAENILPAEEKQEGRLIYAMSGLALPSYEIVHHLNGGRIDGLNIDSGLIDYYVNAEYSGHPLSNEQKEAIRIITSDDSVSILVGKAGTGKSFVMKALRNITQEHANRNGVKVDVFVTSSSWTAATGAGAAAGINTNYETVTGQKNTASAREGAFALKKLTTELDSGKLKLTNNSIIVVDEAGIADVPLFYNLVKHINDATQKNPPVFSKIILAGDPSQFSSIGLSEILKPCVIENKGNVAYIREVRRQTNIIGRQNSATFSQYPEATFLSASLQQPLVTALTTSAAVRTAAIIYTEMKKNGIGTIPIANTNKKRNETNILIRKSLKKEKMIDENDYVNVNVRGNLIDGEQKGQIQMEVCVGETIQIRDNSIDIPIYASIKDLELAKNGDKTIKPISHGIFNRNIAVVEKIDRNDGNFLGLNVYVQGNTPGYAYLDYRTFKRDDGLWALSIDSGLTSTAYSSQGQTHDSSIVFLNRDRSETIESAYVTLSRHRQSISYIQNYEEFTQANIRGQNKEDNKTVYQKTLIDFYNSYTPDMMMKEHYNHITKNENLEIRFTDLITGEQMRKSAVINGNPSLAVDFKPVSGNKSLNIGIREQSYFDYETKLDIKEQEYERLLNGIAKKVLSIPIGHENINITPVDFNKSNITNNEKVMMFYIFQNKNGGVIRKKNDKIEVIINEQNKDDYKKWRDIFLEKNLGHDGSLRSLRLGKSYLISLNDTAKKEEQGRMKILKAEIDMLKMDIRVDSEENTITDTYTSQAYQLKKRFFIPKSLDGYFSNDSVSKDEKELSKWKIFYLHRGADEYGTLSSSLGNYELNDEQTKIDFHIDELHFKEWKNKIVAINTEHNNFNSGGFNLENGDVLLTAIFKSNAVEVVIRNVFVRQLQSEIIAHNLVQSNEPEKMVEMLSSKVLQNVEDKNHIANSSGIFNNVKGKAEKIYSEQVNKDVIIFDRKGVPVIGILKKHYNKEQNRIVLNRSHNATEEEKIAVKMFDILKESKGKTWVAGRDNSFINSITKNKFDVVGDIYTQSGKLISSGFCRTPPFIFDGKMSKEPSYSSPWLEGKKVIASQSFDEMIELKAKNDVLIDNALIAYIANNIDKGTQVDVNNSISLSLENIKSDIFSSVNPLNHEIVKECKIERLINCEYCQLGGDISISTLLPQPRSTSRDNVKNTNSNQMVSSNNIGTSPNIYIMFDETNKTVDEINTRKREIARYLLEIEFRTESFSDNMSGMEKIKIIGTKKGGELFSIKNEDILTPEIIRSILSEQVALIMLNTYSSESAFSRSVPSDIEWVKKFDNIGKILKQKLNINPSSNGFGDLSINDVNKKINEKQDIGDFQKQILESAASVYVTYCNTIANKKVLELVNPLEYKNGLKEQEMALKNKKLEIELGAQNKNYMELASVGAKKW